MKKFLSMLLAVLMVVGMFPMTAFAGEATIPDGLNIVELPGVSAFEEGEFIEYTKWGMSGYSTQTYIATVPAGTETVKITFDAGNVPTWDGNISGGWLSYNEGAGAYDMGGKDLPYEEANGGYAITLDVKSMIENGNYYVKYDGNYVEQYALGFKYAEEVSGPKITLSTDAESLAVGDKFAVTATLSGNEGFNAITLKLDWNDSAVEFTGFNVIEEDGEKYLDSELADVRNLTLEFNQDKGIVTAARTSDTTFNGVLFVANFEVISNGEAEISLKKEFPDFVFANAAGTETKVNFDETDVGGLGLVVPAISVILNRTELTLEEGGANYLLTATVEPSDSTDSVVFTSSDENVATVSKGGNVVSVKPGTATITAAAGSVSAECVVTVTPEENIIRTSKTGYSDFVDSEMTGVKSINYKGEALEIRNLYKVTIQGHEDFYLHNSRSGWSSCFVAYKLDGTLFGGDTTWGSDFSKATFNGSYGYQTREIIVSYDEVKAAVGEENIGKLGISEEDKLAFLVFEKVSATFDYAVLFVIEPVALEGISIDETAEIDKGSTKKLKVTFVPSGAEEVVTWKSSDESVATVDENGVVTAVKNGKATITATAGGFSAECEVTVRTSIKNIPSNGGYSGNVTGIYVSGVVVDNYVWEDKTVTVYVDKNTNATATVVFGWFHSYNQGTSSTYEVEVKNGEGYLDEFRQYGDWVIKFAPTTPTTVLTVEAEMNLAISEEKTLTVNRNEDASDGITYTSSDETVATVDGKGKVKGVAEGEAIITVKAGDLEATCKVTVSYVKAESVKIECEGLENGKLRIKKGDYRYLEAVTTPGFVNDEAVWTTSATDTSVINWRTWAAYFTAEGEGTVTVTVTVGDATDTIEVEVYEIKAESIAFEKTEVELYTGEGYKVKVNVTPEDHSDGRPAYTSSDEAVATIDANGNITGVSAGKATITAKLGELEATCEVTVKDPDEKHVLFKGEGTVWPDYMSTYQVKYILIDNMEIESVTNEGDVYTVTLPHATAKDAEIKLTAIGSGTIAVNWHDGEEGPASWDGYENTFEHSFNLVDGEATVKIRGYKDPGAAGAAREKTKTFKFVIGGECVFDQKVAAEEHLAAEATCTEAATYYMSCLCGANGTETFSDGEALGHDWGKAEYKWSEDASSCEAKRICKNDEKHVETVKAKNVTGTVAKEANCSVMGDTQYKAVFDVDWAEIQYTIRTDIAIDKDAHEWGEWKVVTEPDYVNKGLEKRICKLSDEHFEEKTIEKLVPTATEKVEGPDDTKQYVIAYQEGVVMVPAGLENEYPNQQAVKDALKAKVENGDLKGEVNLVFREVTAGYYENGAFVPVPNSEFFENGRTIDILLKYPEGADENDKFEVYHLRDDGVIEKCVIKDKTDEGLVIEVGSLSPFAIAYESVANNNPKPSEPIEKDVITIVVPLDKAEESNPNTGAPIVCSFDLTAAGVVILAATAAVLEIKRRK